jgi:hypothetical protein
MPALNDYFDLIRVINLPERTDRYRQVSRQLATLGMEFVPGKVEIFAAQRPTALAGFPSLGAHGCFISHLNVLRDAQARGVESVLVMEDDCDISGKNVDTIFRLAEELKDRKWGFVYLGHVEPLPSLARGEEPGLVRFTGPLHTTHLYAAHKSTLGPLIEYLEECLLRSAGDPIGGPMHMDGALSMFRATHPEVVTLLARPTMASQRSSRSDITVMSIELMPGVRQVVSAARKVKRILKQLHLARAEA